MYPMSANAQAHHLGFKIHILDLANDEHRQTTKSLITKETKPSIHQLDQAISRTSNYWRLSTPLKMKAHWKNSP